MSKPAKIPYGLIAISLILFGFSALILITQTNNNTEQVESYPYQLSEQEQKELNIELPTSTPAIAFSNLIKQGDIAFANRNFSKALNYYISAYRVNTNAIEPFIKIIDVYLTTENYPVALKNIELAKERGPKNSKVIAAEIRYYLAQNDIISAQLAAQKASPPTEEIRLYQAVAHIINDQQEQAETIIQELATNSQEAQIKKTAELIKKAFELFATFESGNEAYRDTLIAKALIQKSETKLARDLFYRAIQSNNDYRDAWIGLGYSFLKIKNYKQAEEALNKAKQIDPYKAETYLYQAIVSEEQGNYQRALGLLTQAQNYNYDNIVEIAEHMASNYYALKDYEKAIGNYELVINAKKVPINYFVAPIWIHLEQTKDLERALNIARKSQEYYPEQAESYNYVGWVQLYKGEYDKAKINLTNAISKNPQLAAAYLNFGLLFKQQGKLEGALPYLEKAEKLAKESKDISIQNRASQEITQIQKLKTNSAS